MLTTEQKAPLLQGSKEAGSIPKDSQNSGNNQTLDIGNIIRVADKYYQVVLDAENKQTLLFRDKAELKTDGFVLQQARKFTGFTNAPNFLNYRATVNDFINLFMPLEHTPESGDYPTIETLFRHVGQDKYDVLLDYYSILLRHPKQTLPIVVLVSSEQSTGKSTMLQLNEFLFGNNAIILKVSEYCQQFNGLYASKLIIGIDESAIREDFIKERLKMDSTAKYIMLRKMHTEHTRLPFYGKFFLATNREIDFAKIDAEDIRFFVLKVPKLQSFQADFLDKLKSEAPYFLHFLLHRELSTPKPLSRMWFSKEQLETVALQKVRDNSISDCAKNINEWVADKLAEKDGFGITGTNLHKELGYKYSLDAISKALKDDLQKENKCRRYVDLYGIQQVGRAYLFGKEDISGIPAENLPY